MRKDKGVFFDLIVTGMLILCTAVPAFAQAGVSQSLEVTGYCFQPEGGIGAYGRIYTPILEDKDSNVYFCDPGLESHFNALYLLSGIDLPCSSYGTGIVRNAAGNYTIDFQFGEAYLHDVEALYLRMGDPGPDDCQPQGQGKLVYDIAEGIFVKDAEAADVVVISKDKDLTLERCSSAFDTRVAGVISSEPKICMGPSAEKKPLALAGIVKCRVSAENGRINKGDLLVTSSTPGCAMKADRSKLMTGMLVGVALEPFSEGTGKIFILVNK